MAAASHITSRRSLLGAIAAAPAIAVLPAAALASPSAFSAVYARHAAALKHFDNLPEPRTHEQDDADTAVYSAASRALDEAEPTNWTEFTQKLEHVLNDQDDDLYTRLIADARRLAGH